MIKKKKKLNMSTGKKIIYNSSNSSQVIHSELTSRTYGVTVIGVGSLSF